MTAGLGQTPVPGPAGREFEIALGVFRRADKALSSANVLTEADPDYVAPAKILLAAEAEAFSNSRYWSDVRKERLWLAADALATAPAALLACAAAAAKGDTKLATARIRRAFTRSHNNLYFQALLMATTGQDPSTCVVGRFCPAPFDNLETAPDGNVYFCCPAWLPKPIGNLNRQNAAEIWNSPAAIAIRESVHDGSYRHCSRIHCPKLSGRTLEKKGNITNPRLRKIAETNQTVLQDKPRKIILSHDKSCNISCPSCRTGMILARKPEQKQLNQLADDVIFPLLADADRVRITASGDPFGSAHFQYIMRNIDRSRNSRLKIDLQTNGLLLTEKLWDNLRIEGKVDQLLVSVDAASAATYSIVRRGGMFATLERNLAFMAALRREGRIGRLRLDFVVQTLNFREMPDFIEYARQSGADGVKFQMIRNWGTYTVDDFVHHDISNPGHPAHAEFVGVLAATLCERPAPEYWGMESSLAAARLLRS